MKHHRVVVSQHGGPEVLRVVEEDLPEPEAGQVRLKVLAAGVSAYDLMHRRSGLLSGVPRVPFTLGEDVVGIVDKLGEGVSTLEPGQRAAGGTFSLGGGGYTEFLCLPAGDLVLVPAEVDSAEAVCLVVNYLTADLAIQTAGVQSGDLILIQGAAGGVGTALLDLGRLAGLEMFGTGQGGSRYRHVSGVRNPPPTGDKGKGFGTFGSGGGQRGPGAWVTCGGCAAKTGPMGRPPCEQSSTTSTERRPSWSSTTSNGLWSRKAKF